MVSISPMSFYGSQNTQMINTNKIKEEKSQCNSDYILCKYSQDDIQDLLKKVGADTRSHNIFPNFYELRYDRKNNNVIIDNRSMVNDTVVILSDGSVKHCGSWNDTQLAPKGSYSNIVDRVKVHVEKYCLDGKC